MLFLHTRKTNTQEVKLNLTIEKKKKKKVPELKTTVLAVSCTLAG